MTPNRKKIFFVDGFQSRFVMLVAGSLVVLLVFAGFHVVSVVKSALPPEAYQAFFPVLKVSLLRLAVVGFMYTSVVVLASIFLSHRIVGPTHRLEEEILKMAEGEPRTSELHVREGDEFEPLVGAINKLVDHIRGKKR